MKLKNGHKVKFEKFACCDFCCQTFDYFTPIFWFSEKQADELGLSYRAEVYTCYKCLLEHLRTEFHLTHKEKQDIIAKYKEKTKEYFQKKIARLDKIKELRNL